MHQDWHHADLDTAFRGCVAQVNWQVLWKGGRERALREAAVFPLLVLIMLVPMGLFTGVLLRPLPPAYPPQQPAYPATTITKHLHTAHGLGHFHAQVHMGTLGLLTREPFSSRHAGAGEQCHMRRLGPGHGQAVIPAHLLVRRRTPPCAHSVPCTMGLEASDAAIMLLKNEKRTCRQS